jgi:hypothetical protein
MGAAEIVGWLEGGAGGVSSGDVYARLLGAEPETGHG